MPLLITSSIFEFSFSSLLLIISISLLITTTSSISAFIFDQKSSASTSSEFSFATSLSYNNNNNKNSAKSSNNKDYTFYQHNGFRGLPFFRFGIPSCSGRNDNNLNNSSGTAEAEEDFYPCAILDVNLIFQDLDSSSNQQTHDENNNKRRINNFAQLVVYRVEDGFETKNQNDHVCANRGQLYGAAVPPMKGAFFVLVDSVSSNDNNNHRLTKISSKIPINQEGFYIVYINSCSFEEGNTKNMNSTMTTTTMMKMWSNESKIINLGHPTSQIFSVSGKGNEFMYDDDDADEESVDKESNNNNNVSYISLYHFPDQQEQQTDKTTISFLPPQLSPLVPAFITFTCIDAVFLGAFLIGMMVVGRARVLRYQAVMAIVVVLDLAASATMLIALRAYRDHAQYSTSIVSPSSSSGLSSSSSSSKSLSLTGWFILTEDSLVMSTVFACVRDALLRTLALFLFFGVGITRSRFPPKVSGLILIANVIYVCVKSYVNRDRLQDELSLKMQVPSSSSSSSSYNFELSPARIVVCIVIEILIGFSLFAYYLWKSNICSSKSSSSSSGAGGDHSSISGGVIQHVSMNNSIQKRRIFSRSVSVVLLYAFASFVWLIVELFLFHYNSGTYFSNSNNNDNSENSPFISVAEKHWRLWPLIEIVPKAILQFFLMILLLVWFPSKDSLFYVSVFAQPSSSSDSSSSSDNDVDQSNKKKNTTTTSANNDHEDDDDEFLNEVHQGASPNNNKNHKNNISTIVLPSSPNAAASMRRKQLILPKSATMMSRTTSNNNDEVSGGTIDEKTARKNDDDDQILLDFGGNHHQTQNHHHSHNKRHSSSSNSKKHHRSASSGV